MSVVRYRGLCKYAGRWLAEPLPRSIPLDELNDLRVCSGAYVVCEPLERVQYVGSVCRPHSPTGVADRLREHLREAHKRLLWKTVWIIGLMPDAPTTVARSLEACIGAELLPLGGNRLPRLL